MTSDTKRTFVAVDLSHPALPVVEAIIKQIPGLLKDVRFIHKTSGIHLTLKFLGDTEPAVIPKIKNVLAEIAASFSPLRFRISGTGVFPDVKSPRILWLGLEDESAGISKLAKAVDHQLAKLGFLPEKRSFRAHLTIGRVRKGKRVTHLKDYLGYTYEPIDGEINSFYFFESILLSSGAKYLKLAEYNLSKE